MNKIKGLFNKISTFYLFTLLVVLLVFDSLGDELVFLTTIIVINLIRVSKTLNEINNKMGYINDKSQ